MKNTVRFMAIVSIASFVFVQNCGQKKPVVLNDPSYVKEIDDWHARRIANLKKETGWLNLAGLFWLKEGPNRFGSDTSNTVVFPPKAPRFCGTLTLRDGRVTLEATAGADIRHEGRVVSRLELRTDLDSNTTVLSMGALRWFIIKRGGDFGVRLRDLENPAVLQLKEIPRFVVDAAWKVDAVWERNDPPKQVHVPTILGTIDTSWCYGSLAFSLNGQACRLDPIGNPAQEDLFVIFGDQTNGYETYGGGRYLYAKPPDSTNRVILDFNKAYNPPCVFTDFATCPFPPPQNKLPLRITAGEKMYSDGKREHQVRSER